MDGRNAALLLALLIAAAVAVALLVFSNATYWSVNATLPPVLKMGNSSLYPLSRSWYVLGPINTTYYYIKFMPGWPEQYVVGQFRARYPGWLARLVAVGRSGSGTYAISLGGQVQITNTQDAGPFVPTTAPLVWTMTATSRYSVLARAIFQQGGITAWQWVNFTAEPMTQKASWTFSCPLSTYTETFSNYCQSYTIGFDTTGSWLKFYTYSTAGGSQAYIDRYTGNPAPSVYLEGKNGYGAVFINYTALTGPIPASSPYALDIYLQASVTGTDYVQVNFFIDLNGDGKPDLERIYYISVDGRSPQSFATIVYGYTMTVDSVLYSSTSPPKNQWYTWTIPQVYSAGYIVGVVVAAYSPNGDTKLYVDNLVTRRCYLPANVAVYKRGSSVTDVYISSAVSPTSPPSLATEVDAYGGSGNVQNDYGYALAVYGIGPIPAMGTSVSAYGLYVRNATDAQNNAAFLSVGVDTDGDGRADVEYIYYRTDSSTYALVSSFINPGSLICISTCTNTTQYKFINLGTMTSGNAYSWAATLNVPGAVVGIAFGVVDASGYAGGTSNDFWVFWDDLTVTYSACPLPTGWSVQGNYAWQSYNYLLVTGAATAYTSLVSGGLTYVSNFTGTGTYAVLDSSLNVIFGVFKSGSSFAALCGSTSTALGVYPSAYYVELRPLNGFGDIIVRDQYGNILARYGCYYSATPYYVGFKTQLGQSMKVYSITAWG